MRALVKTAPGRGQVELREMPVRQPGPDELLIRVKYCGLCGTDLHIEADEFPNDPPVIIGHEYCGTVAAAGEAVRAAWPEGMRVVGELHTGACGICALCRAGQPHICPHKRALGSRYHGAFAEYVTIPAWLAHPIPEGVRWEVAGATEPFAIAAHCLVERGQIASGATVWVSGCATMGLLATLWADWLRAGQIIVSGTDADEGLRFRLAREMGATQTVNIQRADLGALLMERTRGEGVDAWIECSGAAGAIAGGFEWVRRTGTVVQIGLTGAERIPIPWNTVSYRELNLAGCFSSPPSAWRLALAEQPKLAPRLRQLVTAILPLEEWAEGMAMMRRGEGVKILLDLGG